MHGQPRVDHGAVPFNELSTSTSSTSTSTSSNSRQGSCLTCGCFCVRGLILCHNSGNCIKHLFFNSQRFLSAEIFLWNIFPGANNLSNSYFFLHEHRLTLNKIIIRCIFSFLFISRELITWPANNCLQISVLLQITLCSCIIETTLLCENGRSVPRALREWFDIFSWSNEPWSIGQLLNSKRSRSKMGPSRTIKSWLFQGLYGSPQHIHYSMKSHIFRKLGCFARMGKVITFGQSKIPKPYWAIWLVNNR